MEDSMGLMVCEGGSHLREDNDFSRNFLFLKTGEQEDIPGTRPPSYLPHPNAYLLYNKRDNERTTPHLSEHLQLLLTLPLYPSHPTSTQQPIQRKTF